MKIQSIGTTADSIAKVDISKVHGGYFSDSQNIEKFIELGIMPIITNLPKEITYMDFGGGQGHLALGVQGYLESRKHKVNMVVADANEDYLLIAKEKGLETALCNLEENNFNNLDLITMRAVLHYNDSSNQKSILKNIFTSLKPGGYLVHQNSSGNKENCELRSALMSIPELGRAGAGNYHWVSEEEYVLLAKEAGFSDTVQVGYAAPNSWSPQEQWDRFNSEAVKKAFDSNNEEMLNETQKRKDIYLKKAHEIIKDYSSKYGKEYLQIEEILGEYQETRIHYSYPIIVSRK